MLLAGGSVCCMEQRWGHPCAPWWRADIGPCGGEVKADVEPLLPCSWRSPARWQLRAGFATGQKSNREAWSPIEGGSIWRKVDVPPSGRSRAGADPRLAHPPTANYGWVHPPTMDPVIMTTTARRSSEWRWRHMEWLGVLCPWVFFVFPDSFL